LPSGDEVRLGAVFGGTGVSVPHFHFGGGIRCVQIAVAVVIPEHTLHFFTCPRTLGLRAAQLQGFRTILRPENGIFGASVNVYDSVCNDYRTLSTDYTGATSYSCKVPDFPLVQRSACAVGVSNTDGTAGHHWWSYDFTEHQDRRPARVSRNGVQKGYPL